jgi:O-antigen/teichoic acid export membrane protein
VSLLIVNAVVPPLIAEMYAQGKKRELEQALRIIATIAGIPAFGIVLVFILFRGPILGLVYGDFYRAGSTVLMLLSLGQLVNVWAGSCGLTLIMTGHQTTLMWVTAFCGLAAVCGSLLLVQRYGPIGVAGSAAFAMVLQNVLMLLAARKRTGLWTHVKISVAVLKTDVLK